MYQGHHPDGSSIQRHSCGAAYPYVVLMVGQTTAVQHPDGTVEPCATVTVDDRVDRVLCWNHAVQRALELANRRNS